MIQIYEMMRKKLERENAIIVSLLLHIIGWFLIGCIVGIVVAFLFGKVSLMGSYAVTLGACMGLVPGYVGGYIKLVKIAY